MQIGSDDHYGLLFKLLFFYVFTFNVNYFLNNNNKKKTISLMDRINVSLRSGNFQFVFGCLIFARFQCKHLHFFLERQFFWNLTYTLLLLLLLFTKSSRTWISEIRRIAGGVRLLCCDEDLLKTSLPINFLGADYTRCRLH